MLNAPAACAPNIVDVPTKKLAIKSPTNDVSIPLCVRRNTTMIIIPQKIGYVKPWKNRVRGNVKKSNNPGKLPGLQFASSIQFGIAYLS